MGRNGIIFALVLFLFVAKGEDLPVVNILFLHQDTDSERVFDVALKFFEAKRNHGTKITIGKVHRFNTVAYNDTDVLKADFCKKLHGMMNSDEKPDIVIDFTRIGVQSDGVKSVLMAMQIPTIAASFGQENDVREWREITPPQMKYLIQVSPPADVIIQSIRSLVEAQSMTSAVLMFDDKQYEMYHKYKSLLQNMPTRHLLTKTELTRDLLIKQVEKLVHVDIVNFFIAGEVDQISEVLAAATNPNATDGPYFSDEFAWYSMTMKTSPTKLPHCIKCDREVTLVHLLPTKFDDPKGTVRRSFMEKELSETDKSLTGMFYIDLTIDAILAFRDLSKEGKWKDAYVNNTCIDFKAKGFRKYPTLDLDLMGAFNKTGVENGMGRFILEKNGKNYPNFTLEIRRMVFSPRKAEPIENELRATWLAGFTESKLISYEKQMTLSDHIAKTVFRIVTVIQAPFVMKIKNCTEDGDKYANCFEGYCIDLLKKIQDELKFNYTIKAVDGYGYMNHTYPHDWDGMVKELQKRKADIALGAMSVMAERESVVDFTVPYYDLVGISILMEKPKTPTSLFKFLTVLENDVWMCILGSYFFTSFLMWIFDRWSPYSYQNNREKYEDDEEKREFNLKECLWFCMTSLTPQGGGESPKNLSGRFVAATWWLFGFIIIASYTANLAAFLTVSRLDAPIESLEDLSKQYKVQYAPMENSSAWIYFDRMRRIETRFYDIWRNMILNDTMKDFERSQLSVWDYPVSDKYTKMWEAMNANIPPNNSYYAVQRVRRTKNATDKDPDGFAFLDEATNVRWQTTISCDFDQKGEEFSRKPYAIAVQKGSPLKESFSHMILKLLNQRFLEQLKETWWVDTPLNVKNNCPKDDNQSDGISIHNIGGVFIVIFVGIVMACFTLIFEYWWYRKRNVSEELAEMALPPPNEFGATFTASTPPSIEKTNFNTQYDKPPERTTLPSIENSW